MSKTITPVALDAAEDFMLRCARLIDRLRFAHLFRGAPAEPVVAALRPYANPDGGFGNALEPDLRGAGSQPQPLEVALWILTECGAMDDPMVPAACDHLTTITTEAGGVPFVLPSVQATPAAPWWLVPSDYPADLNPTAPIAGLLHAAGARHAWLDRATAFVWDRIDALTETTPYEAYGILAFLDRVPDRARAEATFERLAPLIRPHVTLDPEPHASHTLLQFAAEPDGLARRMFSEVEVERALEGWVAEQCEDGGWDVDFPSWAPGTRLEWRGWVTVARLKTLRAYGRFDPS